MRYGKEFLIEKKTRSNFHNRKKRHVELISVVTGFAHRIKAFSSLVAETLALREVTVLTPNCKIRVLYNFSLNLCG